MKTAAIVLAGGSGLRMAGTLPDKILAHAGGRPVIVYSLDALAVSGYIDFLVIVHRDSSQREAIAPLAKEAGWSLTRTAWAPGGTERQDSVWNGLSALPPSIETVLVHDAARPLIQPLHIRSLLALVEQHGAAALCHAVTDTIKELPAVDPGSPLLLRTLDRRTLRAMETPQGFRRDLFERMCAFVQKNCLAITDDTAACEAMGIPVALLENDSPNPKLTTPDDLDYIHFLLARKSRSATCARPQI